MGFFRKIRLSRACLLASCAGFVSTAAAVQAQDADADETASDTGLNTIVVTAQRRQENLQEVPIAVTSISGEAIQSLAPDGVLEFADRIPNLSFRTNGVPTSRISLRGVGNNDFNQNVDTPVGVVLDEIAIVNPVASNIPIYDLESIQVSRGPQGTLFGRNTTGGAIIYTSRRPTDTFEGNLSASYGRFNEFRLEGGVTIPVSDTLSTRFAFQTVDRDGTSLNVFDGNRQNNQNTLAFRGQALWQPSSAVDVLFKIDYRRADQDVFGGKARQLLDPDVLAAELAAGASAADARNAAQAAGEAAFEAAGGPRFIPGFVDFAGYSETDFDPFRVNFNQRSRQLWEDWIGTLVTTIDLGGGYELTSATGYVNNDLNNLYEIDQSPKETIEILRAQTAEQISQEFRLASPTSNPFNWILGVYALRDDLEARNRFGFDETILGVDGFTTQDYDQRTTSLAAFGNASFEVSDALTLTVGARYTWEEKRFSQENFLVATPEITNFALFDPATAGPLIPLLEDTRDFTEWSGRLAVDYKASESVLLYASASRGFRSGGFSGGILFPNSFINSEGLDPFDPEILVAYEVGFKGDLFDDRLRLNIAAFYYDYDDLQVFVFRDDPTTPQSDFAQLTENAASARILGAEIEFEALLSDDLTLSGGIGLLDSEYKDFIDPVLGDFSGNELVAAPTYDANVTLAYNKPLRKGELNANVELQTRDSRFYDASNAIRLSDPDSFTTVNVGFGWTSDEGISIDFFGRNIFGEVGLQDVIIIPGSGFDMLHFTERGTYGVRVGFEF
ncbi:MAG: TonB-dependent receptor [Pseudomonadota bacterium]